MTENKRTSTIPHNAPLPSRPQQLHAIPQQQRYMTIPQCHAFNDF